MNLVERFDFCRLDASRVKQTQQGFLTIGGRLTRVGVLDYYRADGSKYRELRHPEDVFRADSLKTLAMAPVTDLHGGMVGPDNVQALQVGIVGSDVVGEGDGPYVTGSATIQRADTIKAVLDRSRGELSPGYRCWIEDGENKWDGSAYGLGIQTYDGRQRDIEYNHLAIGPKNWGRSGPGVALRMDSNSPHGAFARCDNHGMGGFIRDRLSLLNQTENEIAAALRIDTFELGMVLDGFQVPDSALLGRLSGLIDVPVAKLEGMIPASEKGEAFVSRRRDSIELKGNVPMKKIIVVLDGISYEIEIAEQLATTFLSGLEKQRTDAEAAPELKGKLLAAEKGQSDLQIKLDAATNPEAMSAHIATRTKLIQDAKRIAPELAIDEKADSKAVKIAALVANGFPASEFEHCDEGFVDGCFASTLRGAPDATAPVLRSVPGPVPRVDGTLPGPAPVTLETPVSADKCTPDHADAARERMLQRNRESYQKPLTNGMTSEQAAKR